MRRLAALWALALACAGGRAPQGPATAGGEALASYQSRAGFTCRVPAHWRVQERADGASFFGPASGPRPFSTSIAVYRYPKSAFSSAKAYAALRGGAAKEVDIAGRRLVEYESTSLQAREHGYVLTTRDGIIAMVHAAPSGSAEFTEPIFKALVESFQFR